ncbi:transposase [Marinobacter metalliresistant]|uniref:IS66 family transposase n=1 Tax=Marinobacter metalliresistant TaxID=2961995 RepID=UPI0035E45404
MYLRRLCTLSRTPDKVHSRRYFIDAQKDHPEQAIKALRQVAKLYRKEETIRARQLIVRLPSKLRLLVNRPCVVKSAPAPPSP